MVNESQEHVGTVLGVGGRQWLSVSRINTDDFCLL